MSRMPPVVHTPEGALILYGCKGLSTDCALPRMVPMCYSCSILAVFITTLVVELVLG